MAIANCETRKRGMELEQYLRGGDLDLVEQQLARRRGANAELVLGLAHHQTGRALLSARESITM
jgi:hypothetical protein